MKYQNIKSETKGNVGILTLDRPDALNAFNDELIDELGSALSDFRDDPATFVGIIAGNGRAFSVGADVKEMSSSRHLCM